MRSVILKKDVLQIIQDERKKVCSSDDLPEAVKQACDDELFRVYHKVQMLCFGSKVDECGG